MRSFREMRSIGVQTDPVGFWDQFKTLFTSCFAPPAESVVIAQPYNIQRRRPRSEIGKDRVWEPSKEDSPQEEHEGENDDDDQASVIEHRYQGAKSESLLKKGKDKDKDRKSRS